MTRTVQQNETCVIFDCRPNGNSLYAVKSPRSDTWQRALGYAHDLRSVSVLYLDRARLECVPFSAVQNLESAHQPLPFQAVCCAVSGVTPAVSGSDVSSAQVAEDWSEQECKFFRSLPLVDQEFTMHVESKDDVRAFVDLVDNNGQRLAQFVSTRLAEIRAKAAAARSTNSASSSALSAIDRRPKPVATAATNVTQAPAAPTAAGRTDLARDRNESAFRHVTPVSQSQRSTAANAHHSPVAPPVADLPPALEPVVDDVAVPYQRVSLPPGQHRVMLTYLVDAEEFYVAIASPELVVQRNALDVVLATYADSTDVYAPSLGEVVLAFDVDSE